MPADITQVKVPVVPDFRDKITLTDLSLLAEATHSNANQLMLSIEEIDIVLTNLTNKLNSLIDRVDVLDGVSTDDLIKMDFKVESDE